MTSTPFRARKKKSALTFSPHSNQSHPLTHHGAARKPFVIALVSIAAMVILIMLLFLGKQLVGKAFTGVVNTAGLEDIRVGVNLPFSATVKANLGASSSVGMSFELDLKDGLTCAQVQSVESLLGWNVDMLVLNTARCAGNKITFEYAMMDWAAAKRGAFDVARINFRAITAPRTYHLDFTSFDIIDLASGTSDILAEGADAVLTVAAAQPPIPPGSAAGMPAAEIPPPSGGGSRCYSEWSCPSPWSYCNSNLEQSRSCDDLNRCVRSKWTKVEVRSCAACEESWVCTPWNDCQNGPQTRDCADEHSCQSVLQKPALQKSCQVAVAPGPPPARIEPQLPPPQIQQPAVPVPSFWVKYRIFLIIALAAVILLAAIISAFLLLKPKPVSSNAQNFPPVSEENSGALK